MRSLAVLIGLGVFALDHLTKWIVKTTHWLDNYSVVEGFLTIQLVHNEGIAFGLLHSLQSEWKPIILSVIAIVAVSAVSYYIYNTPTDQRLSLLALGLLLGGILGNFVDRLVNQYVVDFVTLHWKDQFAWPTFNVADSAITTGVFIILLQSLFARKEAGAAALCLMLASGNFLEASPQEDLIDNLQRKYDEIESFSASFEQTMTTRGISQQESGVVMMKKPGKMYWEYQEPTEKYFVSDGEKVYFYVPQDNQVLVSHLDLAANDSPLMFLLGRGDIRRDFEVEMEDKSAEAGEDSTVTLKLVPREPQPEFSELLLTVSPATFLIHKLTVIEPIGQQREYELTNFKQNEPISDRQFELKVPSHVEIIED